MIPLSSCLIETREPRKQWRYPSASDWIGGTLFGLLFFALCIAV